MPERLNPSLRPALAQRYPDSAYVSICGLWTISAVGRFATVADRPEAHTPTEPLDHLVRAPAVPSES